MKRTRLKLDYVALPRRPVLLGLLLLIVALAIAADLVLRYRNARDALGRAESRQGMLNTARPMMPVTVEHLDEQVKTAEAAVRQLTLPWATLIEVLEEAATKDVALLRVHPEARQRLLLITAEARDYKSMLQYQSKLATAVMLDNVHLLNHQVQIDDRQKPLQFTIQATFKVAP